MSIFLCFIASALFTSFGVEGKFKEKFEELRTVWGQGRTPMPFYSEQVEKVAENKATYLTEKLLSKDRTLEIDSVTFSVDDNGFAIFSLVNKPDEYEAIAEFIQSAKLKLEEKIKPIHLTKAEPIQVIKAFGICLVGGVSALNYQDNCVVLAYFEFSYADDYQKLVEDHVAAYNIAAEKLANNFAETEKIMLDDGLDRFMGSVHTVDDHLVLLIQYDFLALQNQASSMRRPHCRTYYKKLNRDVLQQVIASDRILSHFPTLQTADSLLQLAEDGGMSISYRSLQKSIALEKGETTFAYKFCLCLRFKML